jgi:quercetin dioxygenase-like cupin family protein
MQKLASPYHRDPPEARCYYQNGATRFYHAPHQQNLFLRHYAPETPELLSVLLVCRTLAMPGDWHRKVNPDHLAITFVHSGKTLVRIGEESFEVGEGDLFLLPPGMDHEFGTGEKAVRSGIIIQGSLVEPILLNLHGKYVFSKEEAAFAERRWRKK